MFVNLFLMRRIKYNAFDIKNISRYNNGNENGGLAMNEMEYQMIFKRKSFHLFKDTGHLSDMELVQIEDAFRSCRTLVPEIKVDMMIVPADQTSCKRGQEYCILLYSEKKEGYLSNIGYIGEQLDLYLASLNIGALWFGIGKTEERSYNGLDFVIMIAIAKMPQDKFRKDMFKSKRKPLNEVWHGVHYTNIGNIARFAPSACNTQPWKVTTEEKCLTVYRYKKPGKRGIMPADKVVHYNRIDIGIFLCFLELSLMENSISFKRELFADTAEDDCEEVLTARYTLI